MTLKDDLQAIVKEADMDASIAVWHIESGEKTDVNGNGSFPMASVFKIPVIAAAGQQLKQGKFTLNDRILLKEEDKSAGSGILQFFEAGVNPTFRDLLTLMMIISDNTATDMNVALLGGALAIERYMHELGLNDIYLKMDCKNLLKGLWPAEIQDQPLEVIKEWSKDHDIVRDGVTFSRGSDNNVSTALAMNELVYKLFDGQIVEGELKDELLGIMYKQQLNQRLPRFLPAGVDFAHKTGTIGGVCNDSGVMTIGENNHAIVTAFTWWNDEPYWNKPQERIQRVFEVESAIGKVGRLVYDHYSTYSA
ncbi:MAG: class A beta-lactamase-related serine hydrolase [Chloroflexi bacterium]|nr:class A beta-lactamase-related serine hydrolase [Chloroflexota bacterium]MCC6894688.1 serine hydrolase [Anaerolineae bacterium]